MLFSTRAHCLYRVIKKKAKIQNRNRKKIGKKTRLDGKRGRVSPNGPLVLTVVIAMI